MSENKNPVFHVQDGLCFEKLPNGEVKIFVKKDGKDEGEIIFESIVSLDGMASIFASCSKAGDNGEKWLAAKEFLQS